MDSLWVVPKIVYGGRLKRQTAMGWELCTSLLHSLPHTHVNSKGNRPTNLRKATVPNECPQSIESLLWMAWSTLASFQHSTWGQTHMRYSKTHPRTKFSSFFFFLIGSSPWENTLLLPGLQSMKTEFKLRELEQLPGPMSCLINSAFQAIRQVYCK